MLSDHSPTATIAVKDLETARAFYETTLGATPKTENDEGILYTAGSGDFFVYRSEYAGSNKATAMSFMLPDEAFDAEVAALREKGVTFQTFDAPGLEWADGVASMDGGQLRSAWFTDPDGNILNIECGMPTG
ncbi:VOC family protein [uncultured Phycicoccus sp.]|uniref:VOC family protein n=1 Tax=uncultured Phycicoccus sp. TaxID=661422 RepID=UPI002605E1C7|nr:VOC family protein [uncultured Phycicoccus sp.]